MMFERFMDWRRRRKVRKEAKEAWQAVRQAIRMRDDVAEEAVLRPAQEAERNLRLMLKRRGGIDEAEFAVAGGRALEAAAALFPPSRWPRLRENVEVLVVAISLALACRTFFVQPFKIPTGSMQPTLNGVLAAPAGDPDWSDRFPMSWVKVAVFGQRYVDVRAKATGRVEYVHLPTGEDAFRVGAEVHPIQLAWAAEPRPHIDEARSFRCHVQPGDWVAAGDRLASGYVTSGDHVFVNKLAYRFGRPERGDIIVFDTNYIPTNQPQGVAPDTFYIKRLAGMPGERISIADRRLVADGRAVEEPYPFRRLLEGEGYDGYALQPMSKLRTEADAIGLAADQFLPFGDNTHSSLDGRYFGGVSVEALVGPAFFVYWPFGPHFGVCR